MSKKLFNYLSIITSAVAAVLAGTVVYFNLGNVPAITASIPVAEGAIITIMGNFVKD